MSITNSHITPLVSVIIPTFNRAKIITRALDSIVAQTLENYEVIIVDDGSTDDLGFISNYRGLNRVRVIRHSNNRGASAARNTGIVAAVGEFVAFLDSDDCWYPDKLACQVTSLRNATAKMKACATGYVLNKSGRQLTICPQLPPDRFKREILFGCSISPGTTLLIERSVFDHVGLFDDNLSRLEDWDWLLRFAECYDITFVSRPLATIYTNNWQEHLHFNDDDPVMQSIRRIEKRHLPHIAAQGGLRARQFRSTLFIEMAARMYRTGQPVRAFGYVLASLSVYPFRNITFFRTLLRSAISLLRN